VLLGAEKACIELTWLNRPIPTIDVFNKRLVLIIEAIEYERGELLVSKRLPNRGQSIRHLLDLVEESGPCYRLRGEAESRVPQASRDEVVKTTIPATDGVRDD
jgi:hypothetical protein